MIAVKHLDMTELETGLDHIRSAPKDNGVLELIVRRPQTEERELITQGELDLAVGLVGDNWKARGSSAMPDGSANPEAQITIMGSRAAALVAQDDERWPLAGDQLFVDMDLSIANLPPGAQIALGDAILEISAVPHTGCKKFVARFGADAMKFVNSPVGKELRLRGLNAKVVQPGAISVGDVARKL
ncbi:MAG: hypothetical protein KDE47_01130 [Caldilineaceae bacterium]|nr:hypothetical protein [Caldilineaceae bacterium]